MRNFWQTTRRPRSRVRPSTMHGFSYSSCQLQGNCLRIVSFLLLNRTCQRQQSMCHFGRQRMPRESVRPRSFGYSWRQTSGCGSKNGHTHPPWCMIVCGALYTLRWICTMCISSCRRIQNRIGPNSPSSHLMTLFLSCLTHGHLNDMPWI